MDSRADTMNDVSRQVWLARSPLPDAMKMMIRRLRVIRGKGFTKAVKQALERCGYKVVSSLDSGFFQTVPLQLHLCTSSPIWLCRHPKARALSLSRATQICGDPEQSTLKSSFPIHIGCEIH
ncbi:hypothetical protein AAFF_G00131980 [Aldrovandia affinis]|uniref:Uncharacterized protein n=1 Tax=Aldrovandia affinis TaxID=143900 RepID=A0AAD7W9N3_9TELE|nr:hypothetical protein AAFF_G00131980 [Aldrovandia affinis]